MHRRKLSDQRFLEYKNILNGQQVIVCGCGASLKELQNPDEFITIGVNDVGRLFEPDYLVVLNQKYQFKGDRFHYVENSRAKAVFSQLDLPISHPNLVRFQLGEKGGVNLGARNELPYTQNSPYVAVCLAAYMGASRIGLIGVDFTDHHFFSNTGRHALSKQLKTIDQEYARLFKALYDNNIELINLSSQSRLTSLPKMTISDYEAGKRISDTDFRPIKKQPIENNAVKTNRGRDMKVSITKHQPGIVGDFLDGLAETAKSLGYIVSRDPKRTRTQKDVISIVWNGRNFKSAGPVLYCEHAWLPRWEYQISEKGINAGSHLAPFVWDDQVIDDKAKIELEAHLESIRSGGPENYTYMQTNVTGVNNINEPFILVPFQMEWDTNIQRHVPVKYRSMQTLIDDISRANPPVPVIYKQHPADVRRGNRQLRLKLRRKQDSIWRHNQGNIHQLLKSGLCKGIISLNSNVVHDGMIWGVPSVVLGANIWPRKGMSPFLTALPQDWDSLFNAFDDTERTACRDAYAYYLMQNQWKLSDTFDQKKVAALIEGVKVRETSTVVNKTNVVSIPKRKRAVINIVARNRGWFFEDLKKHFLAARKSGVSIRVSERPLKYSDAWIFLRTKEASYSPNPARTIVQIHDMFDENLYRPGGQRHCVEQCAGLVLTNPNQKKILEQSGISLQDKLILENPIGALTDFTLRDKLHDKFTIAWVGRPAIHFDQDLKRADWFVEAVKQLDGTFRVALLGERLESQNDALKKAGVDVNYYKKTKYPIEKYPEIYKAFDCVVITSVSEAGPLCLFESLAVGVPVVSTPVGWSSQLIEPGNNGYVVDSVEDTAKAIGHIQKEREYWFERRGQIRDSLNGFTLQNWVAQNIDLAVELIAQNNKAGLQAGSRRRQPLYKTM